MLLWGQFDLLDSDAGEVGAAVTATQPPRLLDQLRQAALAHFGRPEPGQRFAECARDFILFHGKRHPREMGTDHAHRFLDHLAQTHKDPLRAIEEARDALAFLYLHVLGIDLGQLPYPEPLVRGRRTVKRKGRSMTSGVRKNKETGQGKK